MSVRAIAVAVLLLAVPVLAAKPKVLIDAPAPMAKLLSKTLAKKYTGVVAKRPLSDLPTTREVNEATRAIGAIAVLQARLDGGIWKIQVLNGADGTPLDSVRFKAPKKLALAKGAGAKLEAALKDARAPGAAPSEPPPDRVEPVKPDPGTKPEPVKPEPTRRVDPTPPPAPVEPEPTPEPTPEPSSAERPMALRIGLGFTGLNRTYGYKDDLFGALSQYRLPFGPQIAAELEAFPGAFFTRGVGAHIGIAAAFNLLVGVSSTLAPTAGQPADATRFPTSSMRLRVGLVGRIPIGLLELHLGLGYAMQTYSVAPAVAGVNRPNIPNVNFGAVRPSLAAKFNLTPAFNLTVGAGYHVLISKGEFGSAGFFPRSGGGGIDFTLGIGVRVVKNFELRLQGDYARYFFSLQPQPGDVYIAGGALDGYFSGTLTANFVL